MPANQLQTPTDQPQTPDEKYYKGRGYSSADVALAIIGAGVANAIALLAISTPFTLWNTIVSITIICILFAYAPAPTAKNRLFVAYAAVWSFSFLSGVGIIFNILFELILGSNRFPNNESTAPFYSLPFTRALFFNQHYVDSVQAFTPINIYDVAYFLAWAVVFALCFVYLLYRRKRTPLQSASPEEKPQSEPETRPVKESETPTTSAHLSDTPSSSKEEVH